MDCSLPGFSVQGILKARILERIARPSSGDLLDPGIKPTSPGTPAFQVDSLPLSHQGSPESHVIICNYMLLADEPEDLSPGNSLSKRLLWRGERGARIDRQTFWPQRGCRNIKRLLLMKTGPQNLMNLAPLYVWEDAKFQAHWNHSFDAHLSYLGPTSCAISFCLLCWIVGGLAAGTDGSMRGVLFLFQVSSGLSFWAAVTWWLKGYSISILCLLKDRQHFFTETFWRLCLQLPLHWRLRYQHIYLRLM